MIAGAGSLLVISDRKNFKGEKKRKGRGVTRSTRQPVGGGYGLVCSKGKPEAAILERKRESGVPLFCVPRQRRSSQPENVSLIVFLLLCIPCIIDVSECQLKHSTLRDKK